MVLKLCTPRARARAHALALAVLEPLYQNPLIPKTNSVAVLASGMLRRGGRASAFCRSSSSRGQLGSYLHRASQGRRRVLESALARARARTDKAEGEEKEWVGWLRGGLKFIEAASR